MSFILVTGGTKNIGKEIALLLAKEGEDILLHYRENLDGAQKLKKEIESSKRRCEIIYGDFSTKEGVESFVISLLKQHKKIKGLVNNASLYSPLPLEKTTLDLLKETFWVNLFSPFYLIKELAYSHMEEGGAIVNLGMCGLQSSLSTSYALAYQMSKLSLLSLTKSVAKNLLQKKIRVNMVSPGYTESSVDLPKDPKNFLMGRAAFNKEVAEAVLFFFKHPYLTGQNLEVAGGVRL
jgi:3-oxoacyl-[acyl-carrier protein] reductase